MLCHLWSSVDVDLSMMVGSTFDQIRNSRGRCGAREREIAWWRRMGRSSASVLYDALEHTVTAFVMSDIVSTNHHADCPLLSFSLIGPSISFDFHFGPNGSTISVVKSAIRGDLK